MSRSLPVSDTLWYTVRSCAGPDARRMLTFGAMEVDA
jgi:hypothetical protein